MIGKSKISLTEIAVEGREASRKMQEIKITCSQPDNSLIELLNYIKDNGNTGHSFEIVVDPDGGKECRKVFGWDGDGSDYIKSIEKKDISDD